MPIYTKDTIIRFYKKHGLKPPHDIVDYEKSRCNPRTDNEPTEMLTRITHDREISVIYGHPNDGKTPLACSIARILACGAQLDGVHKPNGGTRSTLILSGEMDDHQWGKYMKWNDRMLPESSDAFVEIHNCQQKLDTTEAREYLEGLVRHVNGTNPGRKKVSVLVLDSIKTLTTAGDNPSRFNAFFENLNILRQEHGWTFIVIHHTNKSGKSYGTVNIDVKVDNMICIGKDFRSVCENITGTEPWIRPNRDLKLDDYYDFVQTKVVKTLLSERYSNSIYFFMGLQKGRMFSTADKLPVLMRMLPEDDMPEWKAVEVLPEDSPYSWSAFEKQRQGSRKIMDDANHEEESDNHDGMKEADDLREERKPSYAELRDSNDRGFVLKWLRKGYAEGYTTIPELGKYLGCKKPQIDYLKKIYGIKIEDMKD